MAINEALAVALPVQVVTKGLIWVILYRLPNGAVKTSYIRQ
jgi:hypothetical protein